MGTIDPFALGFTKCTIEDLKGGDRTKNAGILRSVLSGELTGPVADTVVLNAAAGLLVAGAAKSMEEGCHMAKECLASGKAIATLQKWVESSNAS